MTSICWLLAQQPKAKRGLPDKDEEAGASVCAAASSSTWQAILDVNNIILADREQRWRPMFLTVGVATALILESLLMLAFSQLQGELMTALEQKAQDRFTQALRSSTMLVMLAIPVIAVHAYTKEALDIECRAAVTRRLVKLYLASGGPNGRGAFYKLFQDAALDNPDQRILQDVQDYVTNGLNLVIDVSSSTLKVLGFAVVLYEISVNACWGILAYTTMSTIFISALFGPSLFRYLQSITQQEATLRYCLIRIRENAESVALFRGGPVEHSQFLEMFAGLVKTVYCKVNVITGYAAVMWAVKLMTWIVPVVLVGPSYMHGQVEFGAISKASFACSAVFEGLLVIVTKLPDLSGLSVRLTRVSAIHHALRIQEVPRRFQSSSIGIQLEEQNGKGDPPLEVNFVTLRTPLNHNLMQRTIVENLAFQVQAGQSLLVSGPSGIGKSSLFRCVAGLWSDGGGSVRKCSDSKTFFMPQKPYLCLGTLRDQLLYPRARTSKTSSSECIEVLNKVGLEHILLSYDLDDKIDDLDSLMSQGEQQRLSFARVLLQPELRLVLLDESTSACDIRNEANLYGCLQEMLTSGAYVSIGHRPSLRDFHSHELRIDRSSRGGPKGEKLPSSGSSSSLCKAGTYCPPHLDDDHVSWELLELRHGKDEPLIALE
mmetsp:Transcript_23390/g.54395  ORF Transcript_23390/g.54395 Transcript_23390/m.54395 type:complete len:658 (-) Transcript_23390:48-2021(-)